MKPTPLQKCFDFYWPCIDIRVYISARLFSILSPSHHNMQGWTLIHRKKKAGPVVWNCPVKGSGTPSPLSEPVLESNVRFLYSNTAVDCLTMEPSLHRSFGNWMFKVCNKLLCDLGQWEKSEALYKPSEIALITGCGLLWTTTTWQSLPYTRSL